jgi:hypothetical protein
MVNRHAIRQLMMLRCLSLWSYLIAVGTTCIVSSAWLRPITARHRNERRGGLPKSEFPIRSVNQNHCLWHQSQKSDGSLDIDSLVSDMVLRAAKQKASIKHSQSAKKATGISSVTVPDNTNVQTASRSILRAPSRHKFPKISLKTQLDYARNGHSVMRDFINEKNTPSIRLGEIRMSLQNLALRKELHAWRQKVDVASSSSQKLTLLYDSRNCKTVQDCQDALLAMGVTESVPFLQYFNTWRTLPQVRDLAFALGEAASILMDVPRVRLYQDAVFWKRRHDGPTPWHVDARMAPFDTAHMITFWIPLDRIPKEGGTSLTFCSKSHADFALPYWNPIAAENDDDNEWDRLAHRYPKRLINYKPMSVGDVTVHSGWTLHCSDGNSDGLQDRLALAISYVDGEAEIRPDWETIGDNEDRWSYVSWCKSMTPRTKIHHDFVPIVWPPR